MIEIIPVIMYVELIILLCEVVLYITNTVKPVFKRPFNIPQKCPNIKGVPSLNIGNIRH